MIFDKNFKNRRLLAISCALLGVISVRPLMAAEMTEQEKRDLFLSIRNQPKAQPTPAPTPKPLAPPTVRKSIPKSTAQPKASPNAPQNRAPRPPQTGERPRFGHQGSSAPAPAPAPAQTRPPQAPQGRPPVPTAPPQIEEEGPGFRGTIRNIFNGARERLENLPRTTQSRDEATPVPEVAPASPTVEMRPRTAPKTSPSPTSTVAKNGPSLEKIRKTEDFIPPAPVRSTQPLKHAFPAEEAVAAAKDYSVKLDDPLLDDAIERAEASARKLAAENSDKVDALKEKALAAKESAKSAPDMPESAPPKKASETNAAPEFAQPIAMNTTGSAFERFARQAMAMALTTVAAASAAPAPLVSEAAASDETDDKPDYVKAAERLGREMPVTKRKPSPSAPPSLNDFVISAEHQTDLDMNKSDMTFSGNVIVESSRIHLTCDRFVVHMRKDRKGMAYGEALGHVVINMLDEGKPTGNVGFATTAIYRPDQGEITLSGWPRIEQEGKELVAVTEETRFILHTSGRIKTDGRARTILRN